MKVSVFGLGYVGCVTAACLASKGHQVLGVDINLEKVEAFNRGQSPIIEKGLDKLIKASQISGNLKATNDQKEAVIHGEILLICVGTPSDANGNLDYKYVDRVCIEIGQSLRELADFKIISIRSTLLPGSFDEHVISILSKESGKKSGEDFGIASNPEFLREGSAVNDFNNPPFTILGASNEKTLDLLEDLYSDIDAPMIRTDINTACMVKYACNAFHALKVVFANEIGQLCKQTGIDGIKVMDIFCLDDLLNISTRYLRPGFAFGGSCLPKDLRALLYLARHSDLKLPVLESILPSNRLQIQRVTDLILRDPVRSSVGIIGLTFKPGTDDLRESPVVELAETLIGKGLKVRIYDPNIILSKLLGGNKAFIERALPHISVMMNDTMGEVIQNSDVVVIAHNLNDNEKEFNELLKPNQMVIDLVKITSAESVISDYEGVCW